MSVHHHPNNNNNTGALHSDEEWNSIIDKSGLKIVDVYAKWAGPCEAMQSIFKRMKVDYSGLQVYQAQTDSIEALTKYRNKSCPTFMFFYDSTLVKIVKGANAPAIERAVKEQLDIEKNGGVHAPLILDPEFALGGDYHKKIAPAEGPAQDSLAAPPSSHVLDTATEKPASEDVSLVEFTLAFIKPDAMYPSAMSEIINIIKRNRIEIVNKKKVWLSKEQAEQFYSEHRGTDWFEKLTSFVSSAPILVLKLAKEDVVNLWRQIIGPTSTNRAKEEAKKSVRALYGTDNMMNAVFGSANVESAKKEIEFFFPSNETSDPVALKEITFSESALESTSVSSQKTLLVLLPDMCNSEGGDSKTVDAVVEKLLWSGLTIVKREEMVIDRELVGEMYRKHPQRDEIMDFASSGPSVAFVLKGEDVVRRIAEFVGPADVNEAKSSYPMSLKGIFGNDNVQCAAYCSSSIEEASRDIQLLFPHVAISRHGSQMLSRSESTNLRSGRGSVTNLRSHGSLARSLNNLQREKKNDLLERTLGIILADTYKEEEVDVEVEKEKEVEAEVDVEVEVEVPVEETAEDGTVTTTTKKEIQIKKETKTVVKKYTDIERVVKRWKKDEIMKKIKDYGFKVIIEKELTLSEATASELFKEQNSAPHFPELVSALTSGPVYAFVLEKDSAINAWKELLGPNSPAVAQQTAPTSLRALFGSSDVNNGIFGSDQPIAVETEIRLIFGEEVSAFPEGKQPVGAPHPHLASKSRTTSSQNLLGSTSKLGKSVPVPAPAPAPNQPTPAPEADNSVAAAPAEPLPIEKTLALIKPDAYGAGKKDAILERITQSGFEIVQQKELRMSANKAKQFYAEHDGKPFYNDLVSWMSSAPIYAMVLQKQGGIKAWRELAGPTNSNKAREQAPESIRALFGTDGSQNAVHGSDSPASATREIKIIFEDPDTTDEPSSQDAIPTPEAAPPAQEEGNRATSPNKARRIGSKPELAEGSSKPASRAGSSSNLLKAKSKASIAEVPASPKKAESKASLSAKETLSKTKSQASVAPEKPGSKTASRANIAASGTASKVGSKANIASASSKAGSKTNVASAGSKVASKSPSKAGSQSNLS